MKIIIFWTIFLLMMAPVVSLDAKDVKIKRVDCGTNTLQGAIDKLDKSTAYSLNIFGNCTENVVISGFSDLTLIGSEGASLTATSFIADDLRGSTIALRVDESKVTVQTLTINGGSFGVWCGNRSICDFLDVKIQRGRNGINYTEQSKGNILGHSMIEGPTEYDCTSYENRCFGLGVYNASSVNIMLDKDVLLRGVFGGELSTIISGYQGVEGYGAYVLDGSFLRADSVTFSNNGKGVWAQRNSTIKVVGGSVDSEYLGIGLNQMSTAGSNTEITTNGGTGIFLGPISLFHFFPGFKADGNETKLDCHPTAITIPEYLNLCD